MEIIHADIFDPTRFTHCKKNEHGSVLTVSCTLNKDCPLYNQGFCILTGAFGQNHCPYGKMVKEKGPTKGSTKCIKWIDTVIKKNAGVPKLSQAPTKLAFIGDYVYLPYSFMSMNKAVPFLDHSRLFSFGKPYIKKSDWTIETVIALINYKPRAELTGEVLLDYQSVHVPRFIQHIRELDPDMWEKLIENRPDLNKEQNFIGRKAILNTLKAPFTWASQHKSSDYNVIWTYDGERLRTSSKPAYNKIWGGVGSSSIEVVITPDPEAVIDIQDNSWVTSGTIFTD